MKDTVNSIMRNRNRVLNHRPLVTEKIMVMRHLGLQECSPGFDCGRKLLEAFFAGTISAKEIISKISAWTQNSEKELRQLIQSCYRTGLLEFHATDICDLNCIDCHYRRKSDATMPYDCVEDYFQALNPKAVTITGGGEPNLYNSSGKDLNDLVHLIHSKFPQISLGLINNNTAIPSGNWTDYIMWQRTSVDAANADTYKNIKGYDKYDICIENIYKLLKSNIAYVGIGYLYRMENIDEIPEFLSDWYLRWSKMDESSQEKFNIQFRPISPDIDCIKTFKDDALEQRMDNVIAVVKEQGEQNAKLKNFLLNSTNFYSISKNNDSYFLHEPRTFKRCYNALIHRVLRSDGTEYPDFLLCNKPEAALGNVITADSPEDEQIKIALKTIYYYHCLPGKTCNPQVCRQGWVSNLFETNFADNVPDNYFF